VLTVAAARKKTGNLPKSLEYCEQALRIQRAALGPDHPDVATTMSNVGLVYYVRCVRSLRPVCASPLHVLSQWEMTSWHWSSSKRH
jgi:hypothetical protein